MISGVALDRSFYERDPVELAPLLLNKVLVHEGRAGRIVEVEAYDASNDEASHAYRRKTERNAVMYGPAGHLYVYLSYGMHYCCNVVARSEGQAAAVLIRALAPLAGLEDMRVRRLRAGLGDHHLASGPAKLCQALGIDRAHDGSDLVTGDRSVSILDDGVEVPASVSCGPRIGITRAVDLPWRWWITGDRNVSRGGGKAAQEIRLDVRT